jgi:hypothetical protein
VGIVESDPPLAVNQTTGLPEAPASEDLRRLLAYWNRQRGGRAFPRRADIDPIDLKFMLDRIALSEVHENPRRYRLRLVGGYWYRLAGFEPTGTWLEDWPHAGQKAMTVAFYEALIEGRVPRFTRRDSIVDDRVLSYEIMLLPLSEDGVRISMIMTGIGQN